MRQELKAELVRKGIHALIGFAPFLALWSYAGTLILIAAGILAYVCFETLRYNGIQVPVVSFLTDFASRRRDRGRFVHGPVTLGAGALLSLIVFPPVAAAVAVYTLAVGDSVSSLAGKFFGRWRPAFLCGKSVEGSLACFAAVFLCSWPASGSAAAALAVAAAATVAEALPLKDWDNIFIPLVTGFAFCQNTFTTTDIPGVILRL
ncbi:MAG: phosphatidate cytidylyltransferase [Treponema sp.]|jgi:dolichol kinase|nr:phosphatidate cytidylyltransferase [Treponema sp.]